MFHSWCSPNRNIWSLMPAAQRYLSGGTNEVRFFSCLLRGGDKVCGGLNFAPHVVIIGTPFSRYLREFLWLNLISLVYLVSIVATFRVWTLQRGLPLKSSISVSPLLCFHVHGAPWNSIMYEAYGDDNVTWVRYKLLLSSCTNKRIEGYALCLSYYRWVSRKLTYHRFLSKYANNVEFNTKGVDSESDSRNPCAQSKRKTKTWQGSAHATELWRRNGFIFLATSFPRTNSPFRPPL